MSDVQIENQIAVIVGLFQGLKHEMDIGISMAELGELVEAAGGEVVDTIIQNKAKIEAPTYIGSGKVEEVKLAVEASGANMVVFNDELSGAQIRNLEGLIGVKVIDRTALILDIFAIRAQTKIAKLQVELAQLKYRLPRLIGYGGELSRTGGGIGTRGPGEQKLEMDRRRIQERVDEIRRQIKDAQKNRDVQRVQREKNDIPIVALVGYTNAGKSSIMNQMIRLSLEGEEHKEVFEKDMLFATLDTYSRRIILEDKKTLILVDTVGFVSKLPHSLIEAFKATLEEVVHADLLIHVADISNPHVQMQMDVTLNVLKELKADSIPMITAYNKMDLVNDVEASLAGGIPISARTGANFNALLERLKRELFKNVVHATFLIPYSEGSVLSYLCGTYTVDNMAYKEDGTEVSLEVALKDYEKYKAYVQ